METPLFAERLFGEFAATLGVLQLTIGHKLNLWKFLSEFGDQGCTPQELSKKTGYSERYLREWLECCATHGYIQYQKGKFVLPKTHAPVFLDKLGPYLMPGAICITQFASMIPEVVKVFKSGEGIPFEKYGKEVVTAISEMNHPAYHNEYVQQWIPKLPDIQKKLENGARVADIGCGTAVSSIILAKSFPNVKIDAIDCDKTSIEIANKKIQEAGVSKQITTHCCTATEAKIPDHSCDFVTIFECLHDTPNPVEILKEVKRILKKDGAVLIADEKVPDTFEDMLPKTKDGSVQKWSENPNNFLARLNYSLSVMHCLPQSMCFKNSAAIGTVIKKSTMLQLAKDAGFSKSDVVHENGNWRFYRLDP